MKNPPKLKTAMTPFPYSVEVDELISRALKLMEEKGVRHLPVTTSGSLVGVITERDIRNRQAVHLEHNDKRELRVKDIYLPEAYIVDLNEPLEQVLLTMAEKRLGSAIVTREGKLVGVFTSVDACRCFGEHLKKNFPKPGGDEVA